MSFSFRSLTDMGDVRGKRVLLRLDLNVPLKDGVVFDDFRIRKSLPTIEWLRERGARIICISHCEGKGEGGAPTTLRPVAEYLKQTLPVSFVETYVDDATHALVDGLKDGEMLLLENLRIYAGEKENDLAFVQSLAGLADVYVNEAFSVSHREHASVVGIPQYLPSVAGFLFQSEVEHLSKAFSPAHPFTFILGGAKFETKIPLITKFVGIADTVCVGGALANNFFKEAGYALGASMVSQGDFGLAELQRTAPVVLPKDVVVENNGIRATKMPTEVSGQDVIMDAGPQTLAELRDIIGRAQCVLWNGPLGNFEEGFTEGTEALAKMIAEWTTPERMSMVGGADTLAAISKLGVTERFTFVSSGGGAMLDFLSRGTLPGIEALTKAPR